MITTRYIPQYETIEQVEEWARREGLELVHVERGPDGLLRGMAEETEPDERGNHDLR